VEQDQAPGHRVHNTRMKVDPRRTQSIIQQWGPARLEMARRPAGAHLAGHVTEYCAYREVAPAPVRRREFPGPQIVVIVELGPPIRIFDSRTGEGSRFRGGFVAGIDSGFSDCVHDGFQEGVQINFSPIGARLFFGLPMAELGGRVVAMTDVLDLEGRRALRRIEEVEDWDTRFDLLEELISVRIARARGDGRVVAWALDRIADTGGAIAVRDLARRAGYSQKHLIALFRDFVGVPPKLMARIVRFDRAVRRLRSGAKVSWAALAAELGYYDQAHLVRDFQEFAGATPTDTRRMLTSV